MSKQSDRVHELICQVAAILIEADMDNMESFQTPQTIYLLMDKDDNAKLKRLRGCHQRSFGSLQKMRVLAILGTCRMKLVTSVQHAQIEMLQLNGESIFTA
ncbi:hypothetical protein MUK70_12910 [Dyadobacter chenwenxiniae]|uniref:Uncharacterized protein n=1 Tax=Dyadobacter chenwenxiniae TaxID=2906456 RepID=A0A9X1TDC2_9BACT|nr:hypothetical protein [Dyadobacter chenwenxiniae]MCF0060145.1 hypothetical protein [Dyadobacter chenwenxiniae]UON85882.1 hypothetical protein MUK70_12910 [Dyadobacter chenwenxiniae]